jgi:CheY-like chemotaxis protein
LAEVGCTLLREFGYRTLLAADARQALDQLAGGTAVDLVFSDIMMPGGMSGIELARAVKQRYPRLGMLLTTGYSGGASDAVLAGIPLIAKPYQLGELGRKIRAVLAQRSAASDGGAEATPSA